MTQVAFSEDVQAAIDAAVAAINIHCRALHRSGSRGSSLAAFNAAMNKVDEVASEATRETAIEEIHSRHRTYTHSGTVRCPSQASRGR